jgi:hypothetical protein
VRVCKCENLTAQCTSVQKTQGSEQVQKQGSTVHTCERRTAQCTNAEPAQHLAMPLPQLCTALSLFHTCALCFPSFRLMHRTCMNIGLVGRLAAYLSMCPLPIPTCCRQGAPAKTGAAAARQQQAAPRQLPPKAATPLTCRQQQQQQQQLHPAAPRLQAQTSAGTT